MVTRRLKMAEPLNVRAVRPYRNETEFLEAESWSVTVRSVLLIGVEPVAAGTAVRCELRLKGGHALIVAEGTVVKFAEASSTRPAGLVVRYKRMSSASSDFVKRAVAHAAQHAGSSPIAASSPTAASLPPAPPRAVSSRPPRSQSPMPSVRTADKEQHQEQHHGEPPPSKRRSARPTGTGRRSSRPAGRSSGSLPAAKPAPELHPSAPPIKQRRSTRPPVKPGVAASSRPVPVASTHDSCAMQRLRARSSGKPITSPPDREAVLARLKKQRDHR